MLDYVALGILIFAFITVFYGIIAIHDIPYEISVHRNHPHQDAIHYAGWVSMFTLHSIWPFLWIWATLYRDERGWGFNNTEGGNSGGRDVLQAQLAILEKRLDRLEQATGLPAVENNVADQIDKEST
jgi:hypothetical protein